MSITALRYVTKPDVQAVSLGNVKAHLRVSNTAEDAYIKDLIGAATRWAETWTSRIFITSEIELMFDRFPSAGQSVQMVRDGEGFGRIILRNNMSRSLEASRRDRAVFLPGGKVTAVNSVSYIDDAGDPQVLTGPTSDTPGVDYQEDLTDDEQALIFPAAESYWPSTSVGVINAITVNYDCGFGEAADDVPEDVRHAIRMRISDLFTHRGSEYAVPSKYSDAAADLLEPYVVQMF